jgi:hypothetical protein
MNDRSRTYPEPACRVEPHGSIVARAAWHEPLCVRRLRGGIGTAVVGSFRRYTAFLANAPDGLRRLAQGTKERQSHPIAVEKAHFIGDDVHRVASLFEHQSRGFHTKMLDRFPGRPTGFRGEGSTELARAETRDFGEFFDR